MLKFRKDFTIRVISLFTSALFLLNSTVYGIDLSDKSHLRAPLMSNETCSQNPNRSLEALAETYHGHMNAYIEPQARAQYEAFLMGQEDKTDTLDNRIAFYNTLPKYKGVAIMEIEGLYDNTLRLDHGGQGRFYGGRRII